MCKWGDDIMCLVPVYPDDSHTGKLRWAVKGIDACLADRVNKLNKLNDEGRYTRSCCCGHGKMKGVIHLHDGTTIEVE